MLRQNKVICQNEVMDSASLINHFNISSIGFKNNIGQFLFQILLSIRYPLHFSLVACKKSILKYQEPKCSRNIAYVKYIHLIIITFKLNKLFGFKLMYESYL